MKWFGLPLGYYADDDGSEKIPVPVGEICWYCETPIKEDDSGFKIPHLSELAPDNTDDFETEFSFIHHPCMLKNILGPDIGDAILGDPPPQFGEDIAHEDQDGA